MEDFIFSLTICALALLACIIIAIKTYQKKIKNKKIVSIKKYENQRIKNNLLMFLSVIGVIFTALLEINTLFNSVPSPTIYPLNTDATIYNGTAKVDIESYPIFTVYYSLDGSDPRSGNKYTDSFTITETTTVAAKNRFLHFFWSEPSISTFRFESVQNTTAKTVDNGTDNHIENLIACLIALIIVIIILVNSMRRR